MSTTETRTYERTLYEARLDAECYATCHELHVRLWRRFRLLMRMINGFAGSAAFGGWVAAKPELAGAAGLVLALATAIDQAIDPSEKIAMHKMAAQRYAELRRESLAGSMQLVEFDQSLEQIKAEDEAGIQALLVRACNMVRRGAGRNDHLIEETRWQSFIANLA